MARPSSPFAVAIPFLLGSLALLLAGCTDDTGCIDDTNCNSKALQSGTPSPAAAVATSTSPVAAAVAPSTPPVALSGSANSTVATAMAAAGDPDQQTAAISTTSEKCSRALAEIKSGASTLHMRSAGMDAEDAACIATSLLSSQVTSFSLSYNIIGDAGVIALASSLPPSLQELGLVGCGMSDDGGKALLKWMETSSTTSLRMVCIEGNLLSSVLKQCFQKFGQSRGIPTMIT